MTIRLIIVALDVTPFVGSPNKPATTRPNAEPGIFWMACKGRTVSASKLAPDCRPIVGSVTCASHFDRIHSPLAASQMAPAVSRSVTIKAWIGLHDWQISRVRVPWPLTVVA